MRSGFTTAEYGAVPGFYGNGPELRFTLLYICADPGNGASGAHPGNQNIGAAFGVVPYLWSSGSVMYRGICRIIKLLQHVAVGCAFQNLLRLCNRAFHARSAGRQDEFCAKTQQQNAALNGHGLWHGEDELVSFDGSSQRQSDAGVSARWFHQNGCTWCNAAFAFSS